MAFTKYILPALAIAGSVTAATCSVDATTTIENQVDATGLATCPTFSGSIAIATSTTDNIDLSGIQEITGSLSAVGAVKLPALTANDLGKIGDTFELQNLTVLSSLVFPRLSQVKAIKWIALGTLQRLTFAHQVTMADSVYIENTQLNSLNGLNLEQVQDFTIASSRSLVDITMQIANVSGKLLISDNGRNVSATFPNLIWANNMEINNVSSLSFPSLAKINSSLSFNSDYFTSLNGPNLTTIGKDLSIVSSVSLNNVSFPVLTQINGGLTIQNNTALKNITGFPSLQYIGGALNYYGNFTDATLPKLSTLKGAFTAISTADIGSVCDSFKSKGVGQNSVIQGVFTCKGTVADASNGAQSTASPGSSSSSSSPSTGAAAPMHVATTTGLLGVVAAIFGLL